MMICEVKFSECKARAPKRDRPEPQEWRRAVVWEYPHDIHVDYSSLPRANTELHYRYDQRNPNPETRDYLRKLVNLNFE